MNAVSRIAARLPLPALALVALAGCAGPQATDWSLVSARDQHRYMPGPFADPRPAAIVTAGPSGMVVGVGPDAPAPAVQMVAQDGQLRLVSQQTLAAMRAAQPDGAMGAGPAPSPAPAAPSR